MNLFPEREVDDVEGETAVHDDVLAQAAACDALADAEEVRSILMASGIWSKVDEIVADDAGDIPLYSVEVKGTDIERAMLVIEEWMKAS